MKELIYCDHAAATPTDRQVLTSMAPFFSTHFGNASALHSAGRETRAAIEQSRETVAAAAGCETKEVIFTSGGTEANNWAIFGLAAGLAKKGNHIIATPIEHESVLEPLRQLEQKGYRITWLKVDSEGFIDEEELKKAITPKTIFASIIYANNEIGTVQNIKEIAKILHKEKVLLHTDACQAANYLPIDLNHLGADLMTINSSKIYGPKGAGALIIRRSVAPHITPLLYGGGQEFRMRAGSENTPAIVGFAHALQKTIAIQKKETIRIQKIQQTLIKKLLTHPAITLNGPQPSSQNTRLPNNINITVRGLSTESLLVRLDLAGIAASAGSACSSGSPEPSHVLLAIGKTPHQAQSSIRLTLGRLTTPKQITPLVDKMFHIIDDLLSLT